MIGSGVTHFPRDQSLHSGGGVPAIDLPDGLQNDEQLGQATQEVQMRLQWNKDRFL